MKNIFIICLLFFSSSIVAMNKKEVIFQIKNFITINRALGFNTENVDFDLQNLNMVEILTGKREFKKYRASGFTEAVSKFVKDKICLLKAIKKDDKKKIKTEIETLRTLIDNKIISINIKNDEYKDQTFFKIDSGNYIKAENNLKKSLELLSSIDI